VPCAESLQRDRGFRPGQQRSGGQDLVAADDNGPIVQRVLGEKSVTSRSAETSAWSMTPFSAISAGRSSFHHDECAMALARQPLGCARNLGCDVHGCSTAPRRDQPAQRAEPANSIERPPELGLKDNHQGKRPTYALVWRMTFSNLRSNVTAAP